MRGIMERASRFQADRLIETPGTSYSSPSRKAKKQVNYAESEGEDEDAVFKPLAGNGRANKRRRISVKDESDDDFGLDAATEAAMEDEEGTHSLFHNSDQITVYTAVTLRCSAGAKDNHIR